MRFKYSVVIFLIVVVGTTTTSITGQEEPLPAIHAKGSFEPFTPAIVLAVEPIRQTAAPTLVQAVLENDYVTFEALYRAEPDPAFTTLHELWTYSISDPVGAFYGQEMHDRFARAYPGYASYIAEFRIIDRNGNAFYPTSETRTFLLDRALEGRTPRVQIAERRETPRATQQTPRSQSRTPRARTGAPASSPAAHAASRRSATPKVATPTQAAARDIAEPAGVDASAPLASAPVVSAPAVSTPVAPAQPVTPVVVRSEPAVTQAEPQSQPQPIVADNDSFGSRGILLLVIGLVGIGLLAMMLRTPREAQPTSIMPPQNTVTPPPVEPIRRPTAATQQPPSPGKNRASGSHG